MGGGGYHVDTGPMHVHAKDVATIGGEFAAVASTMRNEMWVTPVTFGALWAPTCVPPFAGAALYINGLANRAGDELKLLGDNIAHNAELYDRGEARTKAIIAKAGPKGVSLDDVMTNDVWHGSSDLPDGGAFGDGVSTVSGFTTLAQSNSFTDGVTTLQSAVHVMFDLVGYIDDPLGGLAGDVLGLLIDFIPGLKQLIDLALGDPDSIMKVSQAWSEMAKFFVDIADQYQESAKQVGPEVWGGDAADGYRKRADAVVGLLADIGSRCNDVSVIMLEVGSMIGDARQFIMGEVCEFLVVQGGLFLTAQALAVETFGASEAAFWAEFEVSLEIEQVEVVLFVAQVVADLVLTTTNVVAQGIQFEMYKDKLDS